MLFSEIMSMKLKQGSDLKELLIDSQKRVNTTLNQAIEREWVTILIMGLLGLAFDIMMRWIIGKTIPWRGKG